MADDPVGSAPAAPPDWAERRLALALEASGIAGAWDWEAGSNLIHGDARACALHGLDPALGARGAPGRELLVHVVPEDRPALDRALARSLAGREPLNIAYRVWAPGRDVVWVLLRGQVLRDPRGAATRLAGVAIDVTEHKDTEAALRESDARFRTIADTMPQIVWSSRTDGVPDYFNRRWFELTGLPEGHGGSDWAQALHPEDLAEVEERWRRSQATGEVFEAEYRLRMADGGYRWFLGRAMPIRDARGHVTRWFGTGTDIHDIRRAAEEREVLSHELSHRIKNIFSITASLISLTARGHEAAAAFAEELRRRINALARAHEFARPHSTASQAVKGRGTLREFLAELLSPYDASRGEGPQVTLEGGEIGFDDAAATPLALIFHEMATNAAKYGALSCPEGRVAIRVAAGAEGIEMDWVETGGPAIEAPPDREGFGSRLAIISVQSQLGGTILRDWRREGLSLRISLPPGALDRRERARQQR